MGVLMGLYAGWLWRDIEGLDALVLWPPLLPPDQPAAFAHDLYHRYLAHLIAIRLWGLEWLGLAAAAILLVALTLIAGNGEFNFGIALAAIGIAFAAAGARFALKLAFRRDALKPSREAAEALVRRVCLREIPNGAPADLADPWRHGWITADGRPVAAEIGEFDLRSTELANRARPCLLVAVAFGLVPAGFTAFGTIALGLVLVIVLLKAAGDLPPTRIRARLLDVAAAGTAEGAAWAFAGASRWAARVEEARKAQLAEAIRDKSPILTVGTALGVLAARGDALAPSAGLDMALSLDDLMQHLLVLGGTGSGKTAGVLRPLCKQLGALDGLGLVVLDGKGSLPGEIAKIVPGLTVIDPSTKKMSLVEGLTPTEIVATVADILGRAEGKDRFFDDSAAGLMRHAAVLAISEGGAAWSLSGIWQIASRGPESKAIEEADVTVPEISAAIQFFREEWPKVEPEVKASILATLRAWITTITSHPDTRAWAETPEGKSEADITAALKGGRLGILAPAHRYGQAGPVVVALLKARLFAAIRDRADKGMGQGETPLVLVMDEAQEITTEEDALILGIARSLRLGIVASTQTVEGIEARLGPGKAAQYLTLFGSVMALQNRSARTADAVASRLGASFRPVLESVPGVPTVRSAVMAQRASGRLAAARSQPSVYATVDFGEGRSVGELLAVINPFQLFRRTFSGEQAHISSRVVAAPLVLADELTELVVEPDTALAILNRGRVPRRDVVKLRPVW